MSDAITLESVLKKDRVIVLGSLLAVVAISWLYLARLAGGMNAMTAGTWWPFENGERAISC